MYQLAMAALHNTRRVLLCEWHIGVMMYFKKKTKFLSLIPCNDQGIHHALITTAAL